MARVIRFSSWFLSVGLLAVVLPSTAERLMTRGELSSAWVREDYSKILNNLRAAQPPADEGTLTWLWQKFRVRHAMPVGRAALQADIEQMLTLHMQTAARLKAEAQAQAAVRQAERAAAKAEAKRARDLERAAAAEGAVAKDELAAAGLAAASGRLGQLKPITEAVGERRTSVSSAFVPARVTGGDAGAVAGGDGKENAGAVASGDGGSGGAVVPAPVVAAGADTGGAGAAVAKNPLLAQIQSGVKLKPAGARQLKPLAKSPEETALSKIIARRAATSDDDDDDDDNEADWD